ncbi:MAG: RNA polymerase sigma factor [Candidatus Magasanikbacteria bacterium]
MSSKYTEKILVHKIQQDGDTDSFAILYDLYIQKIYRFTYLKLGNREEAEDITSEVFLKTWNYLISNKDQVIKSFSGLIYKIARNTLIDFYRQNSQTEISLEDLGEIKVDTKIIKSLDDKQEVQRIFRTLQKMKREYQEVILFKYVEELSTGEIAEILQKNTTNVRVTLYRAIKILKKLLEQKAGKA